MQIEIRILLITTFAWFENFLHTQIMSSVFTDAGNDKCQVVATNTTNSDFDVKLFWFGASFIFVSWKWNRPNDKPCFETQVLIFPRKIWNSFDTCFSNSSNVQWDIQLKIRNISSISTIQQRNSSTKSRYSTRWNISQKHLYTELAPFHVSTSQHKFYSVYSIYFVFKAIHLNPISTTNIIFQICMNAMGLHSVKCPSQSIATSPSSNNTPSTSSNISNPHSPLPPKNSTPDNQIPVPSSTLSTPKATLPSHQINSLSPSIPQLDF